MDDFKVVSLPHYFQKITMFSNFEKCRQCQSYMSNYHTTRADMVIVGLLWASFCLLSAIL